jgi:hypothetical protein
LNKDLQLNITWTLQVAIDKETLDAAHSPAKGGVCGHKIGISLRIKTNFVEAMETIVGILWKKTIGILK